MASGRMSDVERRATAESAPPPNPHRNAIFIRKCKNEDTKGQTAFIGSALITPYLCHPITSNP